MADVNVNIEIEAMPWKKQDKHTLKLQLDSETSIAEIIEYLIDEGKVVVSSKDIDVYNEGNKLSHEAMISDIQKSKKGVYLQFKSSNPKAGAQLPVKYQIINDPVYESQPLPSVKSNSSANFSNTYKAQKEQYAAPSHHPLKKNSSYDQTFSQTAETGNALIKQNPTKNKVDLSSAYSNKQSSSKPNIEFSLKFKQGNYERQFQYSSKKVEQSSEEVVVESQKNSNNVVSIVIVEDGRRMKFQVEKV